MSTTAEPTMHANLPSNREEYIHRFRDYLKSKGQKLTKERQQVVEVFFGTEDHLEAEEISMHIRNNGQRVSRATIYRTIALLVEAGLLKMVSLENRHTLYEKLLSNEDHDHLVCMKCNKVIEFSNELSEKLMQLVCEVHGYTPLRRHFEIVGICDPPCPRRRESPDFSIPTFEKLPCNKEEYMDMFQRYIREHNLKYTRERQEIIEVLFAAEDHLEAEEILAATRDRGYRVSRATVYRTLGLLVEAGLLKMVSLEHRHAHYEIVLCNADHDHLVDSKSDNVIEFSNYLSQKLTQRICAEFGFHPIRRHFEIIGEGPDMNAEPKPVARKVGEDQHHMV